MAGPFEAAVKESFPEFEDSQMGYRIYETACNIDQLNQEIQDLASRNAKEMQNLAKNYRCGFYQSSNPLHSNFMDLPMLIAKHNALCHGFWVLFFEFSKEKASHVRETLKRILLAESSQPGG